MKKCTSILALLSISTLFLSCGILGSKDPAKRTLAFQSTGCLDHVGLLIKEYTEARLELKNWDRAWSCVDDSIKMFDQFVRSNDPNGYSKEEIKLLLGRFIFTQGVTDELVDNIMELKASFIGGNSSFVKREELKLFREFTGILRARTSSIYPYFKASQNQPSPAELQGLLSQMQTLASDLKSFLSRQTHAEYTFDQAYRLVEMINHLQFNETPETTQKWFNFVKELKVTLVSGNSASLEGQDLENLLSILIHLGGSYLVITKDQFKNPEIQISAAKILSEQLRQTLTYWENKLPLSQIEKLIDQSPNEWFGSKAQELKDGVKTVLKPTFAKVFKALKQERYIGPEFISVLYKLYEDGMNTETLLNQLYKGDESLTPKEVAETIKRISNSVTAKRLESLALNQKGLFPTQSSEILFSGPMLNHTRTNLSTLQWYDLISKLVLEGFGGTPEGSDRKGSVDDLKVIVETYRPLLLSIGMVHPKVEEVWKKRFREANLFTPAGNGDNFMDRKEVTTYLTMLSSMSSLSSRIVQDLFKPNGSHPSVCAEDGVEEYLKAPTYDIQCFRREYFNRINEYWRNFPDLLNEWQTYSPAQKERFKSALEMAARREGVTEKNITEYDVASYSGVPHYVEAVLKKYDVTGPAGKPDGVLNREEVVNQVFPVFKNELSKITGINIGFVNKAILIYLMQKGRSPFKCSSKPKAAEIADLLWWLITGKNKKDFQANRLRVYEIFESLSLPATPDCPAKSSSSFANDAGTPERHPLEDVLDYFPKDE